MSSLYSSLPPLFRPTKGSQQGQDGPSPYTSSKASVGDGNYGFPRAAAPADEKLGPPLSDYREALLRWWALVALGADSAVVEVQGIHQDIVRLLDEVGEPKATERRRAWELEWHRETGRCPFCGEPGAYHDPKSPRHG